MINSRSIPLLLLLALTLAGGAARAQSPVDILLADRIEGGTYQGAQVRKIIGNVHLRSDNLDLYCDSAYQFINQNEIRAFGNIQIETEEETIWADTLIYFTELDFSQLRGRVIIEADSTTLFGNSVDYRFSTKVGHFTDQIRLEDQQGVLTAQTGFYYREADSAVFRGQVQLADSLKYIEGDSLFTNRSSNYYELYGDIFADDRENRSKLRGEYLEADSSGHRLLRDNAWLMNYEEAEEPSGRGASPDSAGVRMQRPSPRPADRDSLRREPPPAPADSGAVDAPAPDTTHIRARRIRSVEKRSAADTTTTTFAYENVRIWSTKFAAVADSSRYADSTQTFELYSNAKAWHDEVQLTGPYIRVLLSDGEIQRLRSYPAPFAVQEDTLLDRLNQIKGDTLTAYFEEGDLNEIYILGNSRILRFTKDEEDRPDGAIDMTAPSTRIFFKNGELVELKSIGNIDGAYLPEDEQTAGRRLEGFSWNPEQRPRRPEEQMEPRFPPIPQERPFVLPRRYREYQEARNRPRRLSGPDRDPEPEGGP